MFFMFGKFGGEKIYNVLFWELLSDIMVFVLVVIRNFWLFEGWVYIGFIGLVILMNVKWVSCDEVLLVFIVGVFFVWYVFLINNCFDVDIDLLNLDKVKRNLIVSGEFSFWEGVVIFVVFVLFGMVIVFRMNILMFIFYFFMIFFVIIYFVLLRLKVRLVVDVFFYGFFFGGFFFFYGVLMDGRILGIEVFIVFSVIFYFFVFEFRNYFGDYESDFKVGFKMMLIVFGKKVFEMFVVVFFWVLIVLLVVGFIFFGVFGVVVVKFRINYWMLDVFMLVLLVVYIVRLVFGG